MAAWLRFGRLGTEHLYGDEAEYAIVARSLSRDLLGLVYPTLSGQAVDPFVSQPPLVLYLMGFSMRALGPTDLAAILPSAILGVATVAVAYALAWRLGGWLPALLSSALVAVLPFHVSMSRNAMLDTGYVFFALLASVFLVAWLEERKLHQAVAAGAAGACAALAKLPGVLVAPVLAAGVLAALGVALWKRDRVAAKRDVLHGLAMAAPLLAGVALWLLLLWRLDGLDALAQKLSWNADRVAGGGAGAKGLDYYFTDPQVSFQAQLGPGVFALALAGLGFALFRAAVGIATRTERVVLPVLTLVLAAFFLGSDRKVGFYLLPFAPLAALLVGELAAGVRDMVAWAGVRFTRADSRRLAPLVAALAVIAVAMPAYAAFDESYEEYGPTRNGSTFGYGLREAAAWVHDTDPTAGQYGTLLGRFTLRWYNEHETMHRYSSRDLAQAVEKGQLRFVVADGYVGDDDKLGPLVATFGGQPVARFEREWGRVVVYELQPTRPLP